MVSAPRGIFLALLWGLLFAVPAGAADPPSAASRKGSGIFEHVAPAIVLRDPNQKGFVVLSETTSRDQSIACRDRSIRNHGGREMASTILDLKAQPGCLYFRVELASRNLATAESGLMQKVYSVAERFGVISRLPTDPPGDSLLESGRADALVAAELGMLEEESGFSRLPLVPCGSSILLDLERRYAPTPAASEMMDGAEPPGPGSVTTTPPLRFGCYVAKSGDLLAAGEEHFESFEGESWWDVLLIPFPASFLKARELNDRGFADYKAGNYAQAILYFEAARQLDRGYANAIINLASVYALTGRKDLARKAIEEVSGFDLPQLRKRLSSDPDFQSIRDEEYVRQILARAP